VELILEMIALIGRGGAHFGSDSSYWKGVELMLERVVLGL